MRPPADPLRPALPGPLGWLAAALCASALLLAAPARADGAFPDSLQILLPQDHPQQILLATNFGLLVSADDGQTFRLVCEEAVGLGAQLYQLGAPPADRVLAVTAVGLAVSSDGACSFADAGGALAGTAVLDAFPDPVDPGRVLALAQSTTGGQSLSGLYQSSDGAQTFTGPSYSAPAGRLLSGVEIARGDRRTLALTSFLLSPPWGPQVSLSADGGATWQSSDEQGALGASTVRLAAIDPADPRTLYLRVIGDSQDALAILKDGGAALAAPLLQLGGSMSAFLRRADGTLLVGTQPGPAYRSVDGGQTFTPWAGAPHLRALAERGGALYAAGDDVRDGFALARSSDGGTTWQPLLRFTDICGVLECPASSLSTVCAGPWSNLVSLLGIPQVPRAACGGQQQAPVAASPAAPATGACCSIAGLGPARSPHGPGLPGALVLGWALIRFARSPRARVQTRQ